MHIYTCACRFVSKHVIQLVIYSGKLPYEYAFHVRQCWFMRYNFMAHCFRFVKVGEKRQYLNLTEVLLNTRYLNITTVFSNHEAKKKQLNNNATIHLAYQFLLCAHKFSNRALRCNMNVIFK